MRLSDFDALSDLVKERADLVRVQQSSDKANTFRLVMKTTESGDIAVQLPKALTADLVSVIEKRIDEIDIALGALGVIV